MKKDNAYIHIINQNMAIPFCHAIKDRSFSESIIFEVQINGFSGYGECAPREYVTGESILSVKKELELWIENRFKYVSDKIIKVDSVLEFIKNEIIYCNEFGNNTLCAIELALIDWAEKNKNIPLLPTPLINSRPFVPVIDSVGRCSVAAEILKKSSFIKLKNTPDIKDICLRITQLRNKTNATILIDINNSLPQHEIEKYVLNCLNAGAEWFEEPCLLRDYQFLNKLRSYDAKILLDESVQSIEDLVMALENKAIDGVNIRISKCGGFNNSWNLAQFAKKNMLKRYYGVQVAEIGSLISAGRILSLSDKYSLGVEAGQSDVFFNSDKLWINDPAVIREKGIITRTQYDKLNGRRP
ncbi:hypothetical protein ACEO4E_001589 [Salmonella enterica]|uniref:Enolase C-terminal domain-containing protein n=1 Tax=Salmonella enterica TaxID=28901 RepID=A0A402QCJ3_SALER|nr:hypothetical protein [Salmonella enterica]MIK95247.1 hypothetical protein [Salmonella enterica]